MPRQRPRTLHLICNAHIDPVWLWEWQEGAAETLSTFRAAADLCEEFDGFVFNHNEVILYRWIEEYEPALFERIRRLVREGRWHIMGGWYLQPDCNMPSGESIVRQVLAGRRYFREKFGVRPTTAINFDPFGHSRGLVQILAKAGYDSYLVCRPGQADCPLPSHLIRWVGFDGSEVMALRSPMGYNSLLGRVQEKFAEYLEKHAGDDPVGHFLWGVGNHGGGPSRVDLHTLARLAAETPGWKLRHSTPEEFFADVRRQGAELPRVEASLNLFAVGCYTSQVRVKQKHRELENELFLTEKMATTAWLQGLMEYPREELAEAERDLLMSEFHDILPGSSVQPVEETSLRLLDHGLEILSRVKARAFFALAAGQKKASEGMIPVLVYNPHPFEVEAVIECEFQLPDQNWDGTFTDVVATRNGRPLPSQVEKEASNINLDWRKRLVFAASLKPGEMNRFDCRLIPGRTHPVPQLREEGGRITFRTDELEVFINTRTGLLDRYRVHGVDQLRPKAFLPLVVQDNSDPWGMLVHSFREVIGRFMPLPAEKSAEFSGVSAKRLAPVRVVEEGAVRTVVEAVMGYNDSFLVLTYKLPARGTEIEVQVRVFWNEKEKMLKLSLPTADRRARYLGQVIYGREELRTSGDECVAQKWVAAVSDAREQAVTVINDGTYGSDFKGGEIRLSLLRSPAYSAHPIFDRPVVPQNRFQPRIDQGERLFTFWLNAGPAGERLAAIDREALAKNEKPVALSFCPSGQGKKPAASARLSDSTVLLTAFRRAEKGEAVTARLFEPTGQARRTTLDVPALGLKARLSFTPFEIKTVRLDRRRGWREVPLDEEG